MNYHHLLLKTFSLLILSSNVRGCYESFKCLGITLNITSPKSYNECLEECKTTPGCTWISSNEKTLQCWTFLDCPDYDSTSPDIFSSEITYCGPKAECHEPGLCQSLEAEVTLAVNVNECLKQCKESSTCNYYSYLRDSSQCFLSPDCSTVNRACTDCIRGQKQCLYYESNHNLVMVVGGERDGSNKVEIVDLSGEERTCQNISDFPNNQMSVGTFIDGYALVCGGREPFPNYCYRYSPTDDAWVLVTTTQNRTFSAGIKLDEDRFMITGDKDSGNSLTSDLYFASNQSAVPFVDLPDPRSGHKLVRLNETHIMMVGNGSYVSRHTWIFDQSDNTWSEAGNLVLRPTFPEPGLVTLSNGQKEVMLYPGWDSYFIEHYNLETDQWVLGGATPQEVFGACSVPWQDTFVMLGGYHTGRDVMWYDPASGFFMEWKSQIAFERKYFACFLIPDDYVTCT